MENTIRWEEFPLDGWNVSCFPLRLTKSPKLARPHGVTSRFGRVTQLHAQTQVSAVVQKKRRETSSRSTTTARALCAAYQVLACLFGDVMAEELRQWTLSWPCFARVRVTSSMNDYDFLAKHALVADLFAPTL